MNESTADLLELAHAYGVATEFTDWRGNHTVVPTRTVVAVLASLGVAAETAQQVSAALQAQRHAAWQRMLPPCVVVHDGAATGVPVHVPHGQPVEVWVVTEDGRRSDAAQLDVYLDPMPIGDGVVGRATFEVPGDLPLGWHTLHARSPGETARCPLVVTPSYLGLPDSMSRGGAAGEPPPRAWGFMTQLYSVRSSRSWGHGDLHDLRELALWSAGGLGAGFVLVNPLHAASPVPPLEASPYLPVTRRFVSPLYLRIEDIEEYAGLDPTLDEIACAARRLQATNTVDTELDRDAVWAAKQAALALVHAVPRSAARQSSYEAFLAQEGRGLRDFATWCALAERHGPRWREWPEELRSVDGAAVQTATQEPDVADRIDFYCWLQWAADQQLEEAQGAAVEAGMPLGIVHDLAVGVHPDGADTWTLGDALARGVSVGAPPDAFNQQGQDWSQPPWRPDRLAETAYAPFRAMIRTILRHAGGIRVDHVIGLFRLWWVPDGASAAEGTYVRYDHEALVGILALEAHRAGALVVGEDLGTVEPWVRHYLAERGILGTSILWFERDADGAVLPPEQWRELCLATVTTHDLPPTAGYLTGEHVRIRNELGLLTRPVEEERAVDARERDEWLTLVRERGLLPEAEVAPATAGAASDESLSEESLAAEQRMLEALHRLLRFAPSRLLGVSLADAVGDRRTINQPGTDREYPNWRLPLADASGTPVLLEELVESPRAAALAATVNEARESGRRRP